MIQINKKKSKSQWYVYKEGIEFEIRVYSPLAVSITPADLEETISHKRLFDIFKYILINWKGVVDEERQPLDCNDENKQIFFENIDEAREFIFEKSRELKSEIVITEEEIKN